jgi:hypothetical protein
MGRPSEQCDIVISGETLYNIILCRHSLFLFATRVIIKTLLEQQDQNIQAMQYVPLFPYVQSEHPERKEFYTFAKAV